MHLCWVDVVVELADAFGEWSLEFGDANAILALQMTVCDVVDEFFFALGELVVVLFLREVSVFFKHVKSLVESGDEVSVVHWLDVFDRLQDDVGDYIFEVVDAVDEGQVDLDVALDSISDETEFESPGNDAGIVDFVDDGADGFGDVADLVSDVAAELDDHNDTGLEWQTADFVALAPRVDGNAKCGVRITDRSVGREVGKRSAGVNFVGVNNLINFSRKNIDFLEFN